MDGKIALQVNKLIVHKRIHEYLKTLSQQKPQTKEESSVDKNQEGNLGGNEGERSKKEARLEEGEVK